MMESEGLDWDKDCEETLKRLIDEYSMKCKELKRGQGRLSPSILNETRIRVNYLERVIPKAKNNRRLWNIKAHREGLRKFYPLESELAAKIPNGNARIDYRKETMG